MTRTAAQAMAIGLGAALALIAACTEVAERVIEPRAGLDDELPVPGDAAAQVRELTERRALHDEDRDGFISPVEAEGYYRRHFGELDDDNDGRLSRAELEPEAPGTPDLELDDEELVGTTEQEYVDDHLRQYDLRADRTVGMMSTRDFDEMVGAPDPVLSEPRPGLLPQPR